MYVEPNFETKAALKRAVKAGVTVTAYEPGGFPLRDGRNAAEGPHYPKPHKWYASVQVENGVVTRVLS